MAKVFSAEEVAKHCTAQSCWVILYGDVYDVTDFIAAHPGGEKAILQLAGLDATEDYDPIHPAGLLEANLKPEMKLGTVDPATLPPKEEETQVQSTADDDLPDNVADLLNLHEIERFATKKISKKAWAYYFSAADDLISKSANNAAYQRILLRPRIFVDCSSADCSTSLLGFPVGTPLFVAPAAQARLAHPDGERGIAQGIAPFGACQIISHNASMTPEDIVRGAPPGQVFGWQIYVQTDRRKSEAMLQRINALRDHIKFIVLTLDAAVPAKREHDERQAQKGRRHVPGAAPEAGVGQQMFAGTAMDLTWATTLAWLAQHTPLPVVLKGVQTHEDALLAAQAAPRVRGIILSNHGGRSLDTAPPAVHTLLELRRYCPEVFGRLEVWVDGGVRRGTDVVKALCLGATGVGIGRPPLFGLGADGAAGVRRVYEILQGEMDICMRLLGVRKISDLGMQHINVSAVERDIYNGPANLPPSGLWSKL